MTKSIYIIAGEASGDAIGAGLMQALKAKDETFSFTGIGGDQMQAQRLKSLFDMHQIALMGFVEILPHIPRLRARIKETVADILEKKPDILITIDSPGFVNRVVQKLRNQGFDIPCIHYVAPTVWAYKPERATKTAKLFDALLCILPFEPPYFEKEGLATHFVGHPIAWQHRQRGDGNAFRTKHHIPRDAIVLGMMPGSRRGELARHLPIFRETVVRLRLNMPNLHIIIPTNPNVRDRVKARTLDWPVPVTLVSETQQKADALAACDLSLAKSGTVALETALAGIPTITTFCANSLSVWIIKRMIRVPYVNLMNIMAYFAKDPAPIPELLQGKCNPKTLSAVLLKFWKSKSAQQAQREACAKYVDQLGMNDSQSPSEKAADIVMEYLKS